MQLLPWGRCCAIVEDGKVRDGNKPLISVCWFLFLYLMLVRHVHEVFALLLYRTHIDEVRF